MKLHHITAGEKLPMLPGVGRVCTDLPMSYLFIESVLASGVLNEAGSGRLAALMRAGIAKLQNFLTSDPSTDLQSLLIFLAPTGGGMEKLKVLITQAKQAKGSILDNEDWWRDLFNAFGMKDPGIQAEIRQRVAREIGREPQARGRGIAGPPGQEPEQRGGILGGLAGMFQHPLGQQGRGQRPGGGMGGGGGGGMSPDMTNDLQAERERVRGHENQLRDMVSQNSKDRESTMAEMQRLQAQLDAMRPKQRGMAESFLAAVASGLLQESSVRSNLKFVANNLMRRLGAPAVTDFSSHDWLKDFLNSVVPKKEPVEEGFRDFVRGAGNFLGNPTYGADKMDDSARTDRNERAAKLAVQILFDKLKDELRQRLQVANLSMDDMRQTLNLWNKLMAKWQSGSRDPRLQTKLKETLEQVKKILFAINPNMAKPDFREENLRGLERAIVCG
jgi:hypothetical protein